MQKNRIKWVLGLVSLCLLSASCSRIETIDLNSSSVNFYLDNQLITSDTITVPLNSYREIRIESTIPDYMTPLQYQWQYSTGAPVDLISTISDNFVVLSQTIDQSFTVQSSNSYQETALLSILFSDEVYHSGDLCKLRVKLASGYQEKILNIRVE